MRLSVTIRTLSLTPKRLSNKQAVMIAHVICILSNLPTDASALQSSISTLEREIADLDKSSLSPEFWLPFFTILVGIGVAIEIIVVLRDHKEKVEEWELCKLIPDKPSSGKLRLEIASVILVTVGIFGELGFGLWISHINGQLRTKNAELRRKSEQLLEIAAKELEGEKVKRLELAGSLLDRELRDQKEAIAQLSTLPRVRVLFEFSDDEEVVSTAEQINFVFSQLGWKASRRRGQEKLISKGVSVSPGMQRPGPPSSSERTEEWMEQISATRKICGTVARVLHDSGGIEADLGANGYGIPPDTIVVSVGRKPNPVLEEAIKELAQGSPPSKIPSRVMRGNRVPIPEAEPNKIP
jgi:hypothetical protein